MHKNEYQQMWVDFDVYADFREVNRKLKTSYSREIKIIKSAPIFFAPEDDQSIDCDYLEYDLRLCLMRLEDWIAKKRLRYYVFLNNGLKRYNDFISQLNAYDLVLYDISYPIFEEFDSEKEATQFYEKVEALLHEIRMTESICKRFNSRIYQYSHKYVSSEITRTTFEKTIYSFNKSQKLLIFLQKIDNQYEEYAILVNRKMVIQFDNIKDRDACWEYITSFYEKFEEKNIRGMSTQLFLNDFISELVANADTVSKFEKIEGKASLLQCKFNGYNIRFRLASRNGRYWSNSFEFEIWKFEDLKMVFRQERFRIEYLKNLLQEQFSDEEFMQKYFNC